MLKWSRNGNRPGTQYRIEAKINGATIWGLVDMVTLAKYDHAGQIPGVSATYRVIAKRNIQQSAPSGEASVYSGL